MLITNPLRSEKTMQLLKSYIRLHNLVSVDTVFCWLKEFLRLSGIDAGIFTGLSARTVAASKAKQVGWG